MSGLYFIYIGYSNTRAQQEQINQDYIIWFIYLDRITASQHQKEHYIRLFGLHFADRITASGQQEGHFNRLFDLNIYGKKG